MRSSNIATSSIIVCLVFAVVARAENWPQFRGPTGFGRTPDKDLPITWGGKQHENVLWTANLTGEGHASPIVWGDRVIVCSVKWPADDASRMVIPEHHVTCYATTDGKQLWDTVVPPGLWLRKDFRSGPGGGYAAPTPCTDGKHIFAAFGSSVLTALDFDGHITWRYEIEPHTFDVALGGSPIVYQDSVLLLCAMARKEDSRLVAFNAANGTVKWETRMPTIGFAHSTPVIIDVGGKRQLLVLASGMKIAPDGLQSFDPETGKRLWWCRGGGDASSPAFGDGIIYFDSGRGETGFAVDPTGAGDVSATHIRWTGPKIPEAISSPIIAGGLVYRLHSPDILKCWKADTGELVYSHRLQGLTSSWASPILDGAGHLIFATGGRSVVVKAGPAFEQLAVNDLDDANHASAAVANGRIFILGLKHLYCVGNQ